jgi:hypothetical protein
MARTNKPRAPARDSLPTDPRQFPSYQAKVKGQEELVHFLERFPNWQPWINSDLPVYLLPVELIDLLGPSEERPNRLLTKEEAAAEREFASICLNRNKLCIGMWRRTPICHLAISDFKSESLPQTVRENQDLESSGLTPEQMAENKDRLFGLHPGDFVGRAKTFGYWGGVGIPSGSTKEIDFRHAARSCIGSLLCDLGFVNDIQILRLLWMKLPANLQVPIGDPLIDRDKLVLVAENKSSDVALACVKFSIEYQRVLERWALAGFATWDLPLIQPPLLGIPLFQAAEILPPTARVIYWPPHVQRPPTIDFNSVLKSLQQEDAAFRQFNEDDPVLTTFPSVPGKQKGGKTSNQEKIARMLLWEGALLQRYRRRGVKTRFIEAMQEYYFLGSPQAVKNLRQLYSHLLPETTVD